jgi:hypothetical protein
MRQVYPSCQNQRSEQQTPTGSIATSKRKWQVFGSQSCQTSA